MAENQAYIRVARDTDANWANGRVPRAGEPTYETNTRLFRIGDGSTPNNKLDAAAFVNGATFRFGAEVSAALDMQHGTAKNSFAIQQLGTVGRDRAAVSLASSQARYADAGGWVEGWADTSAWTKSGTFPVAANKLFGYASSNPADSIIVRAVPAGNVLVRSSVSFVPGGSEHYMFFGWTNQPSGTLGSPFDFYGVGLHVNSGGGGNMIIWKNGEASAPVPFANGAGTLYLTAGQDANNSWVHLTGGDGTAFGNVYIQAPKSSFSPKQIGFYSNDARGTSGNYFGRTTLRLDSVTSPDRSNENASPAAVDTTTPDGNNIKVLLPTGYDSRVPAPVVLFSHGFGGNENTVMGGFGTQLPLVINALLANGYIVASSNAGGPNEVGTGWDAYRLLYNYVASRYAVGAVVLLAESFGGVSALRTLAARSVPNVAALVGIYPVTNLASVDARNSTLHNAIVAAYGSLQAAQAAGADPNLYSPLAFRGVPARFYASASDTTVNKAENTVAMAAKMAPLTSEAAVVDTSGDHGDPSNFMPGDVLTFLGRVLGR